MYEAFFGLSGMPFSLLPDADFLFLSRRHQRALNLLDYGTLAQAGFMVITGEVGAGKTTVVRRYLKRAGEDTVVGLITNPSENAGRLLSWVLGAFDLQEKGDEAALYAAFVSFLLSQYARGRRAILIIDEAQNLSDALLEELRMFSNVNNEKDQLLQIVLVGQPELLARLKKPELRQFVQRISVHCHLDPLIPSETAAYIRYRLQLVGGSPSLFDNEACAAVHYFTGGVPRLINLLCDQTLVYCYSEDQEEVTTEMVSEVVLDRVAAGLSPFKALPEGWSVSRLSSETRDILREIEQK